MRGAFGMRGAFWHEGCFLACGVLFGMSSHSDGWYLSVRDWLGMVIAVFPSIYIIHHLHCLISLNFLLSHLNVQLLILSIKSQETVKLVPNWIKVVFDDLKRSSLNTTITIPASWWGNLSTEMVIRLRCLDIIEKIWYLSYWKYCDWADENNIVNIQTWLSNVLFPIFNLHIALVERFTWFTA